LKKSVRYSAFTLTELLIALGIIGAIAAVSIPTLVNNINKRMLVTQLKSHITAMHQLMNDQMIKHKTRNLKETDFADIDKLLTSENFAISKTCPVGKGADCWTEKYRPLNNMSAGSGTVTTPANYYTASKTVVLKNGMLLSCQPHKVTVADGSGKKTLAFCVFDVNGSAGPNVNGRDYFAYFVTEDGQLMDDLQVTKGLTYNEETWTEYCKRPTAHSVCVTLIQNSGWKMNY